MLEYPDMPRTSSTPTEETVAVKKRAPRKRAPKTDPETTPKPRARRPRKEPAPEPEVKIEPVVSDTSGRRAPTQLHEQRQTKRRASRSLLIGLGAGVLLIGAGIGIGISDGGQIDVVAVVNERNEKIQRGEVREGESTITVPVQNTDTRPNGGLIPADAPVPTPEPAATTTPETASSTDSTADTATTTEPTADVATETATST